MSRRRVIQVLAIAAFSVPKLALGGEQPGAIPANFAVGNQGDASYSIPIQVPAGTGSLRPSLALTYNHLAGDGLAGMRWTLSGISAVTRCRQTYAQDGDVDDISYDSDDRFCLDGQRLVNTSGTYGSSGTDYRTEIETFQRIEQTGTNVGGGPRQFTVEHGNGLTSYYGYTTDSRIEQKTGSSAVRVWFISYTEDQFGNRITYSYDENTSTGEAVPDEVTWTSNSGQGLTAKYKAEIVYETRPTDDQRDGRDSGSGVWATTKRINYIKISSLHSGTQEINTYDLTYETTPETASTGRSQLTDVTLRRGANCTTGNCLPDTTFTWQDGTRGWNTLSDTNKDVGTDALVGDLDNDGKSDLFVVLSGDWHVYKGNSSGTLDTAIDTNISGATNPDKARILDYDGDGMSDLLYQSGSTWYVAKSTGTGLASGVSTTVSTSTISEATIRDFDGDGLGDWLYMDGVHLKWKRNNGNSTFAAAATIYSSLGGEVIDVPNLGAHDFNGDGRADLISTKEEYGCDNFWNCWWDITYRALVADGSSYSLYDTPWLNTFDAVRSIDLNGDGLDDLLYEKVGSTTLHTRLNTGYGFASEVNTSISDVNAGYGIVVDFDNDGREDFLRPDGNNWNVHRSTGSLPSSYTEQFSSTSASTTGGFVADLSGDGFPEIIREVSDDWNIHKHKSDLPDVVEEFNDGLGYDIDVTYESLSNTGSDHYYIDSSDDPSGAHLRQFNGARYVVTHEYHDNGIGGRREFDHHYDTAHIDISGRGFLSFDNTVVEDIERGTRTKTWFLQAWPTVGMVARQYVRRASDNQVIRDIDPKPESTELGSTTPKRYFVRNEKTVTKEYEVEGLDDGDLIRTIDDDLIYDGAPSFTTTYGTVDERIVTITEAVTNSVWKTEYDFDVGHDTSVGDWCLGQPGLLQIKKTLPDLTNSTREIRHTWNATNCSLTETRNESEASTADQLKTSYTYDSYGNPNVISYDSVSGAAQDRSEDYDYDTYGQLPTKVTIGTVSLATDFEWDYLTGQRESVTTPDGLETTWEYDDFGRMIKETRPVGHTDITYVDCGTCFPANASFYVHVENSDGSESKQILDLLQREVGRSWTLPDNDEGRVYTTYDADGFMDLQSMPYEVGDTAYYTDYDYDLIGRLTQADADADEATTPQYGGRTTYYYYEGDTHRIVDPESNTTRYVYNAAGQIERVTDALLNNTDYEYHPFGELAEVTDPELNVTTIGINARGLKTSMTDPTYGDDWTYDYTVYDQLKEQTSPIDQGGAATQTLTYDEAGRIKTRGEDEGTTTWYYYAHNAANGSAGRIDYISGPGHKIDWTYNTDGEVTRLRETLDGTNYDFDYTYTTHGQLDTVEYPVTTSSYRYKVNYDYDSDGNMTLVKDGTGAAIYTLTNTDARGRDIESKFGNNLYYERRDYDDADGTLETIKTGTTSTGTQIQYLSHTWDEVGNLETRQNHNIGTSGISETFTYDALNRLKTSAVDSQSTITMQYSAAGRIESKTGLGTYAYNETDGGPFAVTSVGSNTYEYDDNGRMDDRNGDVQTWYTYDLPKVLKNGSTTSTFSYGVRRQRYKQVTSGVTTWYVGRYFEKEVGASTTYRHFVTTGDRVVAVMERISTTNTVQYLHRDHQGSVVEVTDSAGSSTPVESLAYDAWGLRRDASDWSPLTNAFGGTQQTERGYTGHEHLDAVELIHMNGRVQDPILGRFISADPTIQAPYNAQSLNRYSYVWNNPASNTDPSGFTCSKYEPNGPCESGGRDLPEVVSRGWSSNSTYSNGDGSALRFGFTIVGGAGISPRVPARVAGAAATAAGGMEEVIVKEKRPKPRKPVNPRQRYRAPGIGFSLRGIGVAISAPVIAVILLFTPTEMGDGTVFSENANEDEEQASDQLESSEDTGGSRSHDDEVTVEDHEPKIDNINKSEDNLKDAIAGGDYDEIDQAARDLQTISDRQGRRHRQDRGFRRGDFEGDD